MRFKAQQFSQPLASIEHSKRQTESENTMQAQPSRPNPCNPL